MITVQVCSHINYKICHNQLLKNIYRNRNTKLYNQKESLQAEKLQIKIKLSWNGNEITNPSFRDDVRNQNLGLGKLSISKKKSSQTCQSRQL